jgi:hypothetical protein
MKQVIEKRSLFSDQIITFTISEELIQLKGKVLFPEKLAKANKMLKTAKFPAKFFS